MIARFFRYCNKVFDLPRILETVRDGRLQPQIDGRALWLASFLLFLLRLGSLNALEEVLRDPDRRGRWNRLLGDTPPSADALGYYLMRVGCDSLRWVLHHLYTTLQRNRHIQKMRTGGWRALALDGHERFSSYRRCCPACCTRTVQTQKGERVQYYHRFVAAQLVGGPIPVLLDAEEVLPGEDEIAAALRLLERVQARYPKAYDVLTGDAIYADPRIVSFLRAHDKHLIAVLKENHPALLEDARSLCGRVRPQEREHCVWWDCEGFTSWESIADPLRVVRSREIKRIDGERVECDWFWATTFSRQEASTETVWKIGHARWEIENDAFNYLSTHLKFDRPFKHHPNALMALTLIAFIVHLLVCAFYRFNLKPQARVSRSQTTLIRDFWMTLDLLLTACWKVKRIRDP